MAQIFRPSTNTIARVSIFGAVFMVGGLLWLGDRINRSPYVTQATVTRAQPVPFSHKLHAGDLGLDCRHCHTTVEQSAFAGIPATKVCMTCHSQVFSDSPVLEPVRASFASDRSIEWNRVHDLPDFVTFDHSIHLAKGIGCVSCHGHVDEMPLMRQEAPLNMSWCLSCHRNPEQHLRPRSRIFDTSRDDPADGTALGRKLAHEYDVQPTTDCSSCHL